MGRVKNDPWEAVHFFDADGNPEGGQTFGQGFTIAWQRGPLGKGPDRDLPNGAFVEHIIEAAVDRIEFYERSKFTCRYNRAAIKHLNKALEYLRARTANRVERGVEGTNEE